MKTSNTFTVTFEISSYGRENAYTVIPSPFKDNSGLLSRWRMIKHNQNITVPDVYTIELDEAGLWSCTCLGFTERGVCKHVKTIKSFIGNRLYEATRAAATQTITNESS